jgi:hypothetical protein
LIQRGKIADELFQADDFGGNEQLSIYLKALDNRPGFDHVKSLIILRDAETDITLAENAVKSALGGANYATPQSLCCVQPPKNGYKRIATAYALFPAFNQCEVGTLEDLCLKTLLGVDSQGVLAVANGAVDVVEEKFGKRRWTHKSKLHTYLSLTDCVTLKLGESANAHAFDLDADELNPFVDLLTVICR